MFKVGDWVIRNPGWESGWWRTCCIRKGISPGQPVQVTALHGKQPVIGVLNGGSWERTKFYLAEPLNKQLEDYL